MGVRDSFSIISAHQIKGLMLHSSWSDYFAFLGLEGFRKLHDYRYADESKSMRMIRQYFVEHYHELPVDLSIDSNLRKYVPVTDDTSWMVSGEIGELVRACLEGWVSWERQSKSLYEKHYKELSDSGDIAASCMIENLVCDVDQELKDAERILLNMGSVGYDTKVVFLHQERLRREYDRKLRDFKVVR